MLKVLNSVLPFTYPDSNRVDMANEVKKSDLPRWNCNICLENSVWLAENVHGTHKSEAFIIFLIFTHSEMDSSRTPELGLGHTMQSLRSLKSQLINLINDHFLSTIFVYMNESLYCQFYNKKRFFPCSEKKCYKEIMGMPHNLNS